MIAPLTNTSTLLTLGSAIVAHFAEKLDEPSAPTSVEPATDDVSAPEINLTYLPPAPPWMRAPRSDTSDPYLDSKFAHSTAELGSLIPSASDQFEPTADVY